MKRCDLCLKQVEQLHELKPFYQKYDVKEVCYRCWDAIEGALNKYKFFWESLKDKNYDSWYERLITSLKRKGQ